MKEKIFNTIIIFLAIFIMIQLLLKKTLIFSTVIFALNMWVNNIVPALLPFFIISDILINYNIIDYIPKIIKNFFTWLFNITDNMFIILLLSMISGFPSNARNARTLYDKGIISVEEANHILIFSHFANPVFILTTVALFFFKNEKMGIVLIIVHYVSNFILGIIFRNKFNKNIFNNTNIVNKKKIDFGNMLINSIKKSIDTLLTICGIVIIFLIISTIITNTFNIDTKGIILCKGLFEMTIGLEALSKANISLMNKIIMASQMLAFGGISVHVQVLSQIIDTKIKYSYFLMGRLFQIVVSSILSYIICLLFGI